MKKDIRKSIKGIALVAVIGTVLMGCGKKATPEGLLIDIAKNNKEVKSVSSNIKFDIQMKQYDQKMKLIMDVDMETTIKPVANHMEGTMKIGMDGTSIDQDVEMYQVKEDGDDVTYSFSEDEWTREVTEKIDFVNGLESFSDLEKVAKSFELNKEKVKVEGKECFELEGVIEGELLSKVFSEEMMEGLTMGMLDDMEDLEIPVVIAIYKESILPARMSFDMSDVLEQAMDEEDTEVEEVLMEITYKEYNKVKEIKVPKKVQEAASEKSSSKNKDKDKDKDKKKKVEPAKQNKDLGASWDSYTVQINDTVLTLPCTIADLEKVGLQMDTEDPDYIVNKEEYETTYFEDENGNEISVKMVNDTDSPKAISECVVGAISADDYGLDEGGLTIVFPGGVQMGMAKEDVLTAYGDADDVYEGDSLLMYTWEDPDNYRKSCEIDMDAETGNVCSMEISNF